MSNAKNNEELNFLVFDEKETVPHPCLELCHAVRNAIVVDCDASSKPLWSDKLASTCKHKTTSLIAAVIVESYLHCL